MPLKTSPVLLSKEQSALPQASIPYRLPRLPREVLLIALLVMGAAAVFWGASQRYNLEPYALLNCVVAAATAIVVTRKYVPVLLAALLYVGNFKTTAAVGISLTDPTFIVLALCSTGLLIECFLALGGSERMSLSARFAGQHRGVLLFILFLCLIGLSYFYTAAPSSGLIKLERVAVFGSVAFFAPLILFKGAKELDQFLKASVVLSLALSIRNLLSLFHPSAAVLAGNEDITHIGDAELIGTTIVILIYHPRLGQRRSLQIACIGILAIGLATCAARSVTLALLVVLVISTAALRGYILASARRKILLGVMVVLIGGAALRWIGQLPAARAKLAHKEDELSRLMTGSFLAGGTAEQRMTFYRRSLVAISEKPLLGWGVAGWGRFFLGTDDRNAIPHDFILESAVEQGLIGCASLLGLLFGAATALRENIRFAGSQFAFLLPGFLLPVLSGLVTGGLDNRLLWFWCGTIFAVSRMIRYEFSLGSYAVRRMH